MKKYQESQYLSKIDKNELDAIIEETIISLKEYKEQIININKGMRLKGEEYIFIDIFLSAIFTKLIDMLYDRIYIPNNQICDYINIYINDCINNESLTLFNQELIKVTTDYLKIISIELKRIVFRQYLKRHIKQYIIVNKAGIEHIIEVSKTNKRLYYQTIDKTILKHVVKMDYKMANFNKEIAYESGKHLERFEFITSGNTREKSKTILIDMRLLYLDKTYFPTSATIKDFIKTKRKLYQVAYIILPFFLKIDSRIFSISSQINSVFYYNYAAHFDNVIESLFQVAKEKNIRLLIPNLYKFSDYIFFHSTIKNWFYRVEKTIDIGIIIDEYDLIYDIENHHTKIDFAAIDIDLINQNYNFSKDDDFDSFKENIVPILRDIRNVLRNKKIEHFIIYTSVKDERIIEKMLIMGFKKFYCKYEIMPKVINSIGKYMSRREKSSDKCKKTKKQNKRLQYSKR